MLKAVTLLSRFGLAAMWLYSGAVKLANPLDSQLAVAGYELLPESLISPAAIALPAAELILGLMLLLGVFTRAAAAASAALLVMFMAAIVWAWSRGLQIDCGCFGGGGHDPNAGPGTYAWALARDALFLAAAWLTWRPGKSPSHDWRGEAPPAQSGQ